MRDILLFGRNRFREFTPAEHIATNILSDRLERLERAGLLTKRRDTALKNQFIYGATDKGWQTLPVIVELMRWGLQHDAETPVSKDYIRRIKTENDTLVREMTDAIRAGTFTEYRREYMEVDA